MKTGFLGMGNMGSAMAEAAIRAGSVKKENIFGYAPHQDRLQQRAADIGFRAFSDPVEMVRQSDFIFIACKPAQIPEVLSGEMKEAIRGKALLSIAAGWYFEDYEKLLGNETRIQCMNPNIPVKALAGVVLLEDRGTLTAEEYDALIKVLEAFQKP